MFPSALTDVTGGTVDEVMEVKRLLVGKESFVAFMHLFEYVEETLVTPPVAEYAIAQFIECQAVSFEVIQERLQKIGQL